MRNFNYKYNTNYFKNINTENKAYWLGFLYADGSINIRERSKTLELTLQEEDKNHLEKFIKDLEGNQVPKLKQVNLKGKVYNSYRVSVCSTEMCNDLITQGCLPNKSLILKFPKHLRNDLYKHFIRGYVDGDGSLSTRDRVVICGTYEFLDSLQDWCVENIPEYTKVAIRSDKRAKHYQLEKSYKQGRLLKKYLYENSTIYLDRKYNKAMPSFGAIQSDSLPSTKSTEQG